MLFTYLQLFKCQGLARTSMIDKLPVEKTQGFIKPKGSRFKFRLGSQFFIDIGTWILLL